MSVEWVELVACHNRRSEEKEGNDDKQRKYQRDEEKGGSKKKGQSVKEQRTRHIRESLKEGTRRTCVDEQTKWIQESMV
jgi:hypothetical protein